MKPPSRRTFTWFDFVHFQGAGFEHGEWLCVGEDYDEEGFAGYKSLKEAEEAAEAYFEESETKDRRKYALLEETRRVIKAFWGVKKETESGGSKD